MRSAESWLPIVEALGYADETTMLIDLYEVQKMSVEDLAKRLGYSRGIIRQHLKACNITLRPRGGANRKVTSKLHDVPDERFADIRELANDLGMHYSTVYKEARRRGICISALSPQPDSSTDTEDETTTNSVSPNSPKAPTPPVEPTLSGIEEELLRETSSSSTTAPTNRPDGTQ